MLTLLGFVTIGFSIVLLAAHARKSGYGSSEGENEEETSHFKKRYFWMAVSGLFCGLYLVVASIL